MGKKASARSSQVEKKKKAGKEKAVELPSPKYDKTDQKAPPTPACTRKRSKLKEEDIESLVEERLL